MAGWIEAVYICAGAASVALNLCRSRRGPAGTTAIAACTGKTPPWRALLASLEPMLEASFFPRAVALVWCLLAMYAEDGESHLVATTFLVCTPGVDAFQLAAALGVCFARRAFTEQLVMWACCRFCWVPCLLLIIFQCASGSAEALADGKCTGERPSSASGAELGSSQTVRLLRRHPDWCPPRKKESKVYQWAFDVQEELLAVYPCAVHLEVAHQGHLYLSENHVSFQGVTIGGLYTVQFRMPLDNITEVLGGDRRGCAIMQLRMPVELRSSFKKGWKKKPQCTSQLELGDCEEGLNVLAAILCKLRRDRATSDSEDELPAPGRADSLASDTKCSMDNEETPFTLLLEAHLPRLELKPLADDLFSDVWSEGSHLFDYLTKVGLTALDFKPWVDRTRGPVMMRELECIAPVPPNPMCPRTTRLTGHFIICTSPELLNAPGDLGTGQSITILSAKISHDVPFGSRFQVQEKVELIAADGGVDLKISARIVFLGSCGMLTGKIRSSGIAELKKATDIFLSCLRQRCGQAPLSPPSSPNRPRAASAEAASRHSAPAAAALAPQRLTASFAASTSFMRPSISEAESIDQWTVEDASTLLVDDVPTRLERVYELQRRTTVFQNDWKAPFLPHDGRRKWRWTDMNYLPHLLIRTADRELAASSTGPPLAIPAGWIPSGTWHPELHKETDEEGWQYAVDFYDSEKYWGTVAAGRSVRRRVWTCRFMEASLEDVEAKSGACSTPGSQSTKVGSMSTGSTGSTSSSPGSTVFNGTLR